MLPKAKPTSSSTPRPPVSSALFLSADEVIELTKRQRHAAQRRALIGLGITFRVRRDGSLAVLRAHVEEMFGVQGRHSTPKEIEPDWDAMR
jgi:hypothetical protein